LVCKQGVPNGSFLTPAFVQANDMDGKSFDTWHSNEGNSCLHHSYSWLPASGK
jgi:hypothetical protein